MQQPSPFPSETVVLSARQQRLDVANAGELTVLVPYDGLSPHRWLAALGAGLRELATERRAAGAGGVGQGGAQEFKLALGDFRETAARFELRAPWDAEPAAVRTLQLRRPGPEGD